MITLLLLSCSFLMINLPPKRYRNKIWGILFSGRCRLKRAYTIGETVHKDIVAKARWLCERWTQYMVCWIKVYYQVVLKNQLWCVLAVVTHCKLCTSTASVQSWGLTWMITKSTYVFIRINSLNWILSGKTEIWGHIISRMPLYSSLTG